MMKLMPSSALLAAALTAVEALRYGENWLTTTRDSDVIAANFPDTDLDLRSPAFLKPETVPAAFANGTDGPTSQAEMEYFYQGIAARHDWATYRLADFRSEEGRSFPYLFLSLDGRRPCGNGTSGAAPGARKLRTWIQGGIHGNEPAGDQAVMALVGRMDSDAAYAASVLSRMDVMVLPRYNPDGVAYFQRYLASNYDANRDHVKLFREQSQAIKRLFSAFAPHVAVDMHEFGGASVYGGDYVHGADALFSSAKNLNIHPAIRALSEDVFAARMAADLEARGLRWEPYVTGSTSRTPGSPVSFAEAGTGARIGRNQMGLTQAVSFLCETRGIRLADQEFQRRVSAGFTMVSAIVAAAVDNFDRVYDTVTGAIDDFVGGDAEIVLTDYSESENRTFTMVDVGNGTVVQVPVSFAVTTPAVANATRPRPAAYLIPSAWADLVAKLEVLGVEVETLDHEYRGAVEALRVTSSELAGGLYEGAVLNEVTTETTTRQVHLPAGSFRVSTRQRNAALAFIALEPENSDSWVSFNMLPQEEGDEYPIYRIM